MILHKLPRRRYIHGATPIEFLKNLTQQLEGPQIFMKRDDLLGLTGGGNKTRKLEFLVADALAEGADTLITCGAVQSNHCRLTLSAAKKEQLSCHLVLEERVKDSYHPEANGNIFLFHLLGADSITVVPGKSDMLHEMEKVANEVRKRGKRPYIIPGGGSNEIGAAGYTACAHEITAQIYEKSLTFDCIVCASGSAGTHAGLLVGMHSNSHHIPVIGVSTGRSKTDQEKIVYNLANKTAEHLKLKSFISPDSVHVEDDYIGQGYSLPTDEMRQAVSLLAKTEGILLDPVYTGKTMAGLIDLVQKGMFKKSDNILFLHTGGSPALYANTSLFTERGNNHCQNKD
ncbi:D-cysteine desulfhydrase [Siminovitchia sediminis]|uniref:D-cysteine desulfhydrase n=1 Tax=Siminovitchia sediminis TaxID=1274353 RepID=A0ABW4KNW3_9BACI